jgi:hypothetical protein
VQHQSQFLDEGQLVTAKDTNAGGSEKDGPEEQRAMPSLEDIGVGIVEDEKTLDLCSGEKGGTASRSNPTQRSSSCQSMFSSFSCLGSTVTHEIYPANQLVRGRLVFGLSLATK